MDRITEPLRPPHGDDEAFAARLEAAMLALRAVPVVVAPVALPVGAVV